MSHSRTNILQSRPNQRRRNRPSKSHTIGEKRSLSRLCPPRSNYPETTSWEPITVGDEAITHNAEKPGAQQFIPTQSFVYENGGGAGYPAPDRSVPPRKKRASVIGAVVVVVGAAAAGIAWAALGDWNSDNDDAVIAETGKPDNTSEADGAASDSNSVKTEAQEESEAPLPANQDAVQKSDEDKAEEPQAAVGEHCGEDDSLTAYEVGVSYIEPYRGSGWRPDVDGYDPCAKLSWITITLEGATASSPYHIMLYHHGEFLGTATAEPYAFSPRIQQVSDSEIAVTYRWPLEGEGNANPSGRTHAGFHWDDGREKVIMTGDVPSY